MSKLDSLVNYLRVKPNRVRARLCETQQEICAEFIATHGEDLFAEIVRRVYDIYRKGRNPDARCLDQDIYTIVLLAQKLSGSERYQTKYEFGKTWIKKMPFGSILAGIIRGLKERRGRVQDEESFLGLPEPAAMIDSPRCSPQPISSLRRKHAFNCKIDVPDRIVLPGRASLRGHQTPGKRMVFGIVHAD